MCQTPPRLLGRLPSSCKPPCVQVEVVGGSFSIGAGHHPPNHPNPTRRPRFALHFQWGGSGNIEKPRMEPVLSPTRNSDLR
eukprot:6677078-Pyramimonas_sp.AAC.1